MSRQIIIKYKVYYVTHGQNICTENNFLRIKLVSGFLGFPNKLRLNKQSLHKEKNNKQGDP